MDCVPTAAKAAKHITALAPKKGRKISSGNPTRGLCTCNPPNTPLKGRLILLFFQENNFRWGVPSQVVLVGMVSLQVSAPDALLVTWVKSVSNSKRATQGQGASDWDVCFIDMLEPKLLSLYT